MAPINSFESLCSIDSIQLPLSQAFTLRSEWYTEQYVFDEEIKKLFSNQWNFLCLEQKIPEKGSYTVLQYLHHPVIAIRDRSNEIKVFYNVCRHRGGPLAYTDGIASKNVLQCQYHGWTYMLDGSLRGVPQFDKVDIFDKKDFGLIEIPSIVVNSMIFICFGEPNQEIPNVISTLHLELPEKYFSSKRFHTSVEYIVDCNWKVYADNYLEGYHIPLVHPTLNTMLSYRNYKVESNSEYVLQHSPITNSTENELALYYFVYPSMMLNILPGRLQTNVIIPITTNQCKVIFDYYYDVEVFKNTPEYITEDIRFADEVQKEDATICKAVFQGLSSNAYSKGRFSVETEQGVYSFQQWYRQQMCLNHT